MDDIERMIGIEPYRRYRTGLLYNNNCIDIMEYMSECIDLIITSPPYPGNNKMWGELFSSENFLEAHKYLSTIWLKSIKVLNKGCKLVINIANTKRRPYLSNVSRLYENIEAEPLGEIIWNKGYGQMGTAWGSYCNPSDISLNDQHEYIVIFRKYGERNRIAGYHIDAKNFKSWRNSIWNIACEKASKIGHIAPYPLEIPRRLIILYSYENEIVLDMMLGSSTTAVACIETNRRFICIEKEEKYCKISDKRIRDAYEIKKQMKLF